MKSPSFARWSNAAILRMIRLVMKLLASTYDEKRGGLTAGSEWKSIRCASVSAHLSLAVIKMDRPCDSLAPALSVCLRAIAGVLQVQIDAPRRMIQLLYDGELGTVKNIHRFLVATGWTNDRDTEPSER